MRKMVSNKLRDVTLTLISGFLTSLASLAYNYKWATLVIFGKVSDGIAFGYPSGFITIVANGRISDYVGSAVTFKFGNYYFIPIAFGIDLVFWTILSGIIMELFKWVRHNRKTRKRSRVNS